MRNIELDQVITVICNYLAINKRKIYSRERKYNNVLARHLYYYFSYKKGKYSYEQIAKYIGFDHASAIHGIKRIHNMISVGLHEDMKIINDLSNMLNKVEWNDIYTEKMMQRYDTQFLSTIKKYINEILIRRL
jgi:chromosomal replication initiation ATPase DnaA